MGIQNGRKNSIALVDESGNVVDFISYEGAVLKVDNGAAKGLTPVDIGVKEEGKSTPKGYSLQKEGTGCARDDFSWTGPKAETKNTANKGQIFSCVNGGPISPTNKPTKLLSLSSFPSVSPTDYPTKSPSATPSGPLVAPQVAAWINEFHYDNTGSDSGEFVEIAYTSSVTITDYQIVLYNGNGGATYDTDPVPNGSCSGNVCFSVLNYPSNGIQNGSPDGIALVDGSGNVVEFLSYEGILTASNGPASGLASTNIGVSETSSTPIGHSLQRTGTGCAGSDFSWAPPNVNTKNSVNDGQTISCGPAPPLTPSPSSVPSISSAPSIPLTASPSSVPSTSSAPSIDVPVTKTGVKVLAYNILSGGTGNSAWKDIIKAENADIIVFTETGNWDDNNDQLLNQNLNEFNNHFTNEVPYTGSTVQGIGFANSANAIMTRFPIVQTTQLTDNELSDASAHDLMVWKLDVGNGKFVYVIGIHLKCCGGSTNDSRRNDTMENLIIWIDTNINAGDGIMLMGDFNAVSPVDTDPSFPGYQPGFEPSSDSSLNDGPIRMLIDSNDPKASTKHTFKDAFREANPVCGSNNNCCADALCDEFSLPNVNCPERGYSFVGIHNFDSRIDFIIVNQQVQVSVPATVGDVGGGSVCTASDHLPVDAIVSF